MTPKQYECYLPYAKEHEREKIEAIIKSGGIGAGARLLGKDERSFKRALKKMRERVAREDGFSVEGELHVPMAAGEILKARSRQLRDEDGNIVWQKSAFTNSDNLDALNDMLRSSTNKLFTIPELKQPDVRFDDELCTVYTITDYHMGMMAWEREGGEKWDMTIAKNVLMNAFQDMIAGTPNSKRAVFNQLGDFLHFDGFDAVTPMSKHLVDASARFGEIVELALEVVVEVTGLLLKKHEEVHVMMCEGNHDMSSSIWLRTCLKKIFADNPRVVIETEALPFYGMMHGDGLLGFHHGHKVKNDKLPMLFASEPKFRSMWGQAKWCAIHTGHYHHAERDQKEDNGAIVERFPTLSARDAYSSRGGYVAARRTCAITYAKDRGEVDRKWVHPRLN